MRGLGLGLAIVERIGKVLDHAHRPAIGARPRLDVRGGAAAGGAACPAAEQGVLAAPAAGRIAGLKVLCIDNEPDVLNGMQALLEGWGCTADPAQNAAEAIERLRETGGKPDIILADYHLDGGTGLEAVAALRAAAEAARARDRHHRGPFRGGAARGPQRAATPCCASR